ncbi:hypothetical protein BKA65DRAFT_259758 [Rhexocercosporidium sp. MPI-PUGE-AT-0058]|nr:hypothetical protein BKA65DRAFT_259758 [Rhexocercosporidium sp. MPI-PUGE-AT-0058]
MSVPQFMNLVPELQEQIAHNCQACDLLALAQTCSSLHGSAMRALYYHVDISTHNIAGIFPARSMFALAENPIAELPDEIDRCISRQRMFIRSMRIHPEYGARVTRLTWTYFSLCSPTNDKPISDRPTWRAFECLTSVKYVDFASMAFQRERNPPPPLFPAAEHVRLAGPMSFAFVRAILLSGQPERFVSLDLDNVLDLGQYKEGRDFAGTADLSLIPESVDSYGNSITRHPGNMRGHLRHLEGRCPRLKYLCLRSVGNDEDGDDRWAPALDEARYDEWASFITSVRASLVHLVIEQGLEPNQTGMSYCRRPIPVQYGRPMDDRFLAHLLPALLTGGFSKLKEIHVFGIGADARAEIVPRYRPKALGLCQFVYENLLAVLGQDVEIEVQENATKTFFYRLSGNTYDS